MQIVTISEAQKMSSPNPFGLISVKKENGDTNLMAVSWWTYTSNHPASIAVCLNNKGYSGSRIREERLFALSLVVEEMKNKALLCGACSGRDVDKAKEFGVSLAGDGDFSVEYVADSSVVFLCELTTCVAVGDHTMYFAEVRKVLANPGTQSLHAMDGYKRLAVL